MNLPDLYAQARCQPDQNLALHSRASLPVLLLNSAVLTAYGDYCASALEAADARTLVMRHGFTSAIGHEGAARVLGQLLGIACPVNRVQARQTPGQCAIVLRLARRTAEGAILDEVSLRELGFRLMLLRRVA